MFSLHPDCSTALATWMLCFITTFAFVAAYEAAKKAGEALEVSVDALNFEKNLVLAISLCADEKHDVVRLARYINQRSSLHGREFLVDESPADDSTSSAPEYVPVNFEFENLGRTAILDLRVDVQLNDQDPVELSFGSIGKDRSVHVAVYLNWGALQRPSIVWLSPAKTGTQPFDFMPMRRINIERPLSELTPSGRPKKWTIAYIEKSNQLNSEQASPLKEG